MADDMLGLEIDDYMTVLNRPGTYKWLAFFLQQKNPIVFAWTEEQGSQLDILMCIKPMQVGLLQRGIRGSTDLFVSVMGWGAFGFEINEHEKHPGYVAEKLHLGTVNVTAEALAELINGVIKELRDD